LFNVCVAHWVAPVSFCSTSCREYRAARSSNSSPQSQVPLRANRSSNPSSPKDSPEPPEDLAELSACEGPAQPELQPLSGQLPLRSPRVALASQRPAVPPEDNLAGYVGRVHGVRFPVSPPYDHVNPAYPHT
jgi:hypothetical protein